MHLSQPPYIVKTILKNVNYRMNLAETFYEICGNKKPSLLLESAEINKKYPLNSMMIIDTAIRVVAYKRVVFLEWYSQNGKNLLNKLHVVIPKVVKIEYLHRKIKLTFPTNNLELDEDLKLRSISVFDCFRFFFKLIHSNTDNQNAIFFGGLFAYDLVNIVENLSHVKNNNNCPDYCFYLSEVLLKIDHLNKNSIIQGSIFLNDHDEESRINNRILEIQSQLEKKPILIPSFKIENSVIKLNFNDIEYQNIVKKMQSYIQKGEVFQVVPSRQFSLLCPHPLAAYHTLKLNNPSPYMFFMQDNDFTLFGASPESSLKYNPHNRQVELYPIAGTRKRGFDNFGKLNTDLDSRIELEMRTNAKELSEHVMLVDLARNDLAKICIAGTRYVDYLTKVDRYSHVMHLVSKVVGTLQNDLDALHAYSACMNMGTLTGAPKIRAMELISEMEKIKRGSYGGSIGYFTGSGLLDTCIVIRSAYVENNIATVQAGAGVVIDSIPIDESNESRNKAQVVLNSIIQSNYK